ncbi:MAG: ABC transporter ATP-binding protein [Rhodospirillaceae bacterium]|nr:ABC transporter ATP-binding protein [Rhodospirillaceae bacterium]
MSRIDAQALSVRLGRRRVIENVSLAIGDGEMVGLLGPNGAGKTTLLRCLAGLLPGYSGTVNFDGVPIGDVERNALARRLAYLPQSAECHWPISVRNLVALGRLPHRSAWGGFGPADRVAIDRAIETADLAALAERPVNELSGGERTRAMLARALATEPASILADEPIAGLDPAHRLDVMALLQRLALSGLAVLVVLHDLTLAARYCHRLILLRDGHVQASGRPADVFTPGLLADVFGVRAHMAELADGPLVVPVERLADPSTSIPGAPR